MPDKGFLQTAGFASRPAGVKVRAPALLPFLLINLAGWPQKFAPGTWFHGPRLVLKIHRSSAY